MSSSFKRLNAQIREEASEWLVCFSEAEVDAAAREAFTRWLHTSPEHVRAYLRVSAFWHDAELIGKATRGDVDALVERALGESNVVRLGTAASAAPCARSDPQARGAFQHRLWTIAAALLILGVGTLFAVLQFYGRHTYATAIGELRTITLADGSRIELNARSKIQVRFSAAQRHVELLEGQALFSVAKDPARPFRVHSGVTDVWAIGTQFDVNRKPGRTVVTLIEGRVAVSQAASERTISSPAAVQRPRVLLSPGEQVTVTAHTIIAPMQASLAATRAWTEGLLMFDSAPLSEVVREFNRHNIKPMVITDARLMELRISGTFPATGRERLTGFLQERFGITAREREDEIRLTAESSSSSLNPLTY